MTSACRQRLQRLSSGWWRSWKSIKSNGLAATVAGSTSDCLGRAGSPTPPSARTRTPTEERSGAAMPADVTIESRLERMLDRIMAEFAGAIDHEALVTLVEKLRHPRRVSEHS